MSQTGQLSLYLVSFAMTAFLLATVAFAIDLTRGVRTLPQRPRQLAPVGAVATVADGVSDATGVAGSGTPPPWGSAPGEEVADRAAAPRRRAAGVGLATYAAGTLLLAAGVVTRGIAAGRAPWANMYEFTLMAVLIASLVFLGIQRVRDVRFLGTFLAGFVTLSLLLALKVLYLDAAAVQPALQSYWLVIHVAIATSAVGLSTVAGAISIVQLFKDRWETRAARSEAGIRNRVLSVLPSAANLERLSYRVNAVGFVMWTLTLITGSIWAEQSWGRYWGWDAKEVWTFVTWVIYAAYLHARATRGWEGRRAAWFSIAGLASILVNYYVINLFVNSLHSYAGV